MSSKQEVRSSDDSSSSSDNSLSSSSRESSPERAPEPAPAPPQLELATAKKRKSKSSRSHSSHKRSKSKRQKVDKKERRTGSAQAGSSHSHAQQQAAPSKITARDIMGADSDIDEEQTGKKDELTSYLSRRVANGISKQYNNKIEGSQFVDLKVFVCSDIENISPMNRWRHAIVTLKTKIDENSVAYRYLTKFLKEVKGNFKDSTVAYVSAPNQ